MPQAPSAIQISASESLSLKFLLYLPPDYDSEIAARWPLLIFLHGAGERGADLKKLTRHGPPKAVAHGENFPFVLASPQCPAKQIWNKETIAALADHLVATLRVDPARLYLTGISMGGYGAWDIAMHYPARFAAVAPICGGGSTLPLLLAPRERLPALRRLPIWAFHGAQDDIVPLDESERMIRAFEEIGNKPRLTVFPDLAHDCWDAAYGNAEFYSWLLAQKLRVPREKS